jgi:branched-chain amino acid transport system substrate-binding protein
VTALGHAQPWFTPRPTLRGMLGALALGLSIACTAAPPAAGPISTAPAQTPASAPALSGPPVRVALNTEITGTGALVGDLAKKAADIAVAHINQTGGVGGRPMELIVEDAQSSNEGALAALNKAAGEDHVVAMVGPIKSTQILAIEARIRELELPTFIGGTNPTLTQHNNPWLFRLRPTDALAGPAAAHFMAEDLQLRRVGILHDSDAGGTTGADLVEQALKNAGRSVVRRESYKTGDRDFTAQLLSLKQAGIDGLVLYTTNPDDGAVILRQAAEQGLEAKLIGSPSYSTPTSVSLAHDLVDGLNVVTDYFPNRTPESQAYYAAWQAAYGTTADPTAAWNWDALHILRDLYPTSGATAQQFREAVLHLKDYRGAVGTISFAPNGDGLHSVDVARYTGTQLEYVRTVGEQP